MPARWSGLGGQERRLPALLLGMALAAAAPAAGAAPASAAGAAPAPAASVPPVVPRAGAPASFADLAAALLPAVVNVSSSETVKGGGGDDEGDDDDSDPATPSPFPPGSPFEKFFHDYMNRQHDGGDSGGDAAPRRMQSLGSGFIIDPSGLVVTNNHVIAGADEITVTLQNNTVLKAKLIGHDDRTDLALLQVKPAGKLPAVAFGDSDRSRVGDWVVAIGNPFGLGGTVTAGIISARGRDIQQGPYDDFIQTDAPINRGNSGGPLFDMSGAVIGINTAIYSPSGGSIGIGFAIPSDEAKLVIDQLRRYGHARRGWIGVHIQAVTPDIAASLKRPDTDGALVASVDGKGPAAKAGLKAGDLVLAFNDVPLHEMRALPRTVAETAIGTTVPVRILRGGHEDVLHLTVAELPDDKVPAPAPPRAPTPKGAPPLAAIAGLGLTLAPLDDAARAKWGIAAGTSGAVVTAVGKTGEAANHGLKPGDVIVQVEQSDVARPGDVDRALADARAAHEPSVLMLVVDKDGQRWVPLPLPGPPAATTNRKG